MKIPVIHGFIDRRILINFTVDPLIAKRIVPDPFFPKVYKGKAIVGICLIRLKNIKPKGFPDIFGVSSENAAHRIAVEWHENDIKKEGVYIPRRDTSLKLNSLIGGRLFPGKHHLAKFTVKEVEGNYHLSFVSNDNTTMSIDAKETEQFSSDSIFGTLQNASDFFEQGSVGYSPKRKQFEGLKLNTYNWSVAPLEVTNVKSSLFEDQGIFPANSIKFDNALLMKKIEHEWNNVGVIE
ncbi:MAG: DUF2071 domain-containing protein [Bacteroidota bacterium]